MADKPLISVVFSFRNEEDVIPELVRRVQAVFEPIPYDYEMIFVNDDSSDRSRDLLEDLQKKNPHIKLINMSRRFGVTPCVLAGFHYASGDAVVYMDCDLQDPPEVIPRMIEKWQNDHVDVVHTTRTSRKGENRFKLWLTDKAYGMINLISDIEILNNTGDFKLISKRAVKEILRLREFDPFMRGLSVWIGFKQDRIFYERDERFAGETKFSLWSSINPYKEFLRGITRFSDLPLYFGLVLGLLVSFGSFLYLIVAGIAKLFGNQVSNCPAAVIVNLFLGGTILFTIGVLGVYIGIIHKEVKNRPRYVIESTSGINAKPPTS